MEKYVNEFDLNHKEICKRAGGYCYGDEDFDVFKCPSCGKIFLTDYEIGSVFLNGQDLSEIISDTNFLCPNCGYDFYRKITSGPKSDDEFKVTEKKFRCSEWGWALLRR